MRLKRVSCVTFFIIFFMTALMFVINNQWISRINLVPRITNSSAVLYGKHKRTMMDRSSSTEQTYLDNHYLICSDPSGRLGNWMFQFSAAFATAHTLRYKLCIESSHPLIRYFEIEHIICKFRLNNMTTITEAQFRSNTWNIDNKYILYNLTLSGYFQSWKYFINSTNEIRKVFTFKPTYLNKAREFLASKIKLNDSVVGLHIRRGDFRWGGAQTRGYTVANVNYIKNAIEFYREKYSPIKFVIVSDDMNWCDHNIKGANIIYSNFTEAADDMALLSLCNHTIITGGSFGWWGGWLAGGTVVYLKDFPRPGSWLEKQMVKREDYYLPHWIGMSNG